MIVLAVLEFQAGMAWGLLERFERNVEIHPTTKGPTGKAGHGISRKRENVFIGGGNKSHAKIILSASYPGMSW